MRDGLDHVVDQASGGSAPPPMVFNSDDRVGETYFARFGLAMHSKKWCCYPQERSGRLQPARIDRAVIDCAQYQTERPSDETFNKWIRQAAAHNVAVIVGPPSANAIAFHIDVADKIMSLEVQAIASDVFGRTPFRVTGDAPRITLFYRLVETATFNKRTLRLAKPDNENAASEHMVEILAKNSSVTVYGRHHSTGNRFQWFENPSFIEPSELSLITEDQISEFERQIDAAFPLYIPASRSVATPAAPMVFDSSDRVGETYFAGFAREMHRKNWCVYPQERKGRRLPARIDGEVIAWSKYQTERPSDDTLERWIRQASTHNVAMILGPCSANALALDIDVTDEIMSLEVQAIAEDVFGFSPYQRTGRAPKIMLFYRLAETATFNKRVLRLAKPDDENAASEHMVEILAKNSTVTVYGRHHSTGGRFQWLENPSFIEPSELLLISEEQLDEFERRLDEKFTLFKGRNRLGDVDGVELGPWIDGEIRAVKVGLGDAVTDGVTGLITDGREGWATRVVFELCRSNAEACRDETGREAIAAAAFRIVSERVERTGRWAHDRKLMTELRAKVRGTAPKVGMAGPGGIKPRIYSDRPKFTEPSAPSAFDRMADSGLEWLTGGRVFRPRPDRLSAEHVDVADLVARQEKRKLLVDRDGLSKDVAAHCERAATRLFWDAVRKQNSHLARVLRLPPGSGKTSNVMRTLIKLLQAEPDRLKDKPDRLKDEPAQLKGRDHFVFVVRTYRALRELMNVAAEAGATLITHDDATIPGPAVKGQVYVAAAVGKKQTKCPRREEMDALETNGIPSHGLCKAGEIACIYRKRDDTTGLTGCGYYNQPDLFASARIIICVVPYLTHHNPPKYLTEDVVGLIVDEDPSLAVVRAYSLKTPDFLGPRNGALTKSLIKQGFDNIESVRASRETAVKIAWDAMIAGRDPAAALVDLKDAKVTGEQLVECARACVDQPTTTELKITPNMAPAHLQAVVEKHKRSPVAGSITAERAFWRVVQDRMTTIRADRDKRDLWQTAVRSAWTRVQDDVPTAVRAEAEKKARKLDANPPVATTRGATDARLQLREPDERGVPIFIRISRRIETNFGDVPALILDASAQIELTKKVFDREVKEIRCDVRPHLRVVACLDEVFSDASLIPAIDDDYKTALRKERRVKRVRLAITKLCDHIAPFRVILVTTRKALAVVFKNWVRPNNLDDLYFGDVRGYDWAKNHSAIVTIGRSQMPPDAVDASAAAYGYDDENGYEPFDKLGTGYDARGVRISRKTEKRTLQLRNGYDIKHFVPMLPAGRARQIEQAWREEELRQAVGRLRVVHRNGREEAPIWLAIGGSAISEDVIVDEIVALDDLIADAADADARRRAGEIAGAGEGNSRVERVGDEAAMEAAIAETRSADEAAVEAALKLDPDAKISGMITAAVEAEAARIVAERALWNEAQAWNVAEIAAFDAMIAARDAAESAAQVDENEDEDEDWQANTPPAYVLGLMTEADMVEGLWSG